MKYLAYYPAVSSLWLLQVETWLSGCGHSKTSTCVINVLMSVHCSYLSSVLGNKFDHGAEAIVPVLFNLIPNCAKVMATSGVSAIRIIIRVGFTAARVNTSSSFGSTVSHL